MSAEEDNILLPRDSRIIKNSDGMEGMNFVVRNEEEGHYIHNRNFRDVDAFFDFGLTDLIDEAVAKDNDQPVQIVDIGGGMNSVSVREIGEKYGERVHAVNVDIAHNIKEGAGANRIQADARRLPIADETIDIIYTRQLIQYIAENNKQEHQESVRQMLSEIARVLKNGGTAVLDDGGEISGPRAVKKRQEMAKVLGVELSSQDSLQMRVPELWERFLFRRTRPETFLVLKKPDAIIEQ